MKKETITILDMLVEKSLKLIDIGHEQCDSDTTLLFGPNSVLFEI